MNKSQLIELMSREFSSLPYSLLDKVVKEILECMVKALVNGGRIEIRGFGSFSLHYYNPRIGRNPKTGDRVELNSRYMPHFKPGKELKNRGDDYLR